MNRPLLLGCLLLGCLLAGPRASAQPLGALERLPLAADAPAFVENRGQWPDEVAFLARLDGVDVWVTASGLVYDYYERGSERAGRWGHVVRTRFVGGQAVRVEGRRPRASRHHYLLGDDASRWATDVPTFEEVVLHDLYDGVSLRLYAADGVLRQELVLGPQGDPDRVRVEVEGAEGLGAGRIDRATLLGLPERPAGALARPEEVGVPFREGGRLRYARFLGGAFTENARAADVDPDGSLYVGGRTESSNFPTPGGYDLTLHGVSDGYVARLSATGALLYGTYLGGNAVEEVRGVAYAGGSVYLTGVTTSPMFPTTPGAYDESGSNPNEEDAFVTRLRPDGTGPVFSTYLGGDGNDAGGAVAVTATGTVVVGGRTYAANFPAPSGSYQGGGDAFVVVLSADGSALLSGTFLGGSGLDEIRALELGGGSIYAAGDTDSNNFAGLAGSFGGGTDAFVVRLNGSGSAVTGGRYVGGSGHEGATGPTAADRTGAIDLALGGDGTVYVAGGTASSDFPATVTLGPRGGTDAFVTRLGSTATNVLGSTVFGGSGTDRARGIDVAPDGTVHVAGATASGDFPVEDPEDGTYNGQGDGFVVQLTADGAGMLFGTYLGGSGADGAYALVVGEDGFTYVVGETESGGDFPVTITPPAHAGEEDAFAASYDLRLNGPPVVASPLPDTTLLLSDPPLTVDLDEVFEDPEGDALAFTCESSAPGVASVGGCATGVLTVTPVGEGTATITVTASDGSNPPVSTDFTVVVVDDNEAPVVVAPIPDAALALGGPPLVVDLGGVFEDPDGDALTYGCQSSAPGVASVACAGSTLTVTPQSAGEATITVTATDPEDASASDEFVVTVTNPPPVVTDPIPDVSLALGDDPFVVDLSTVFTDPNGDDLAYSCASSAPETASVGDCSGGTLTVTPVSEGTATVTVTANDGAGAATDAFLVTVTNPPPVIVAPIPDVSLALGGDPLVVDLDTVFADPNGDVLAYGCASSAPGVASVGDCSGGVLTVTPESVGAATITVTANDGSAAVTEAFVVTVVNPPPVVVQPIADFALLEGGPPFEVDLDMVFADPNGDELAYSFSVDANVVLLALDGSVLSVTPNRLGEATVTVTATDGTGSATDTFVVTVTDNLPPVVVNPPADTTLVLGGDPLTVDLNEVFEDPEGQPLTFGCTSSAPAVAAVGDCSGGTLTVTPVGEGTATVTLTATDPTNPPVSTAFVVTVVGDNLPPVVVAPIPDAALALGGPPLVVDLGGVFEDPDGDALTYGCQSSAPGVASVGDCSGGVLTVTPQSVGEATITVTASDGNHPDVGTEFVVAVVLDLPPVVASPLPDAILSLNAAPLTVDLDTVFVDPEGEALVYGCSSSDTGIATVSNCSDGTLTVTPVSEGAATITVTATDPEDQSAEDAFVVTVVSNAPPVVRNPLPDVSLLLGDPPLTVDLDEVFEDPEGDALAFTCESSAPGAASVGDCSGGVLTVTPVGEGTATITVTASDPEGASASDAFVVTVGCAPAAITAVTPSPAEPEVGEGVVVSASAEGSEAVVLRYRQGGAAAFSQAAMAWDGERFVATIPGEAVTERGVEFYVEAETACGSLSQSGYHALRVAVPGGLVSPALPAAAEQSGYRLVSVPLLLEEGQAAAVLDDFGPAGNEAWRLFELLPPGVPGDLPAGGTDEQWYREDPASTIVVPGRAFWLIARDGGTFNTGPGTTVPAADPFSVELHPGWNLVGTPFGYDVPLDRVRLESGAPLQLQAYEGAWRAETGRMSPFRGYALRTDAEDRLLVAPSSEGAPRPVASRGGAPAAEKAGAEERGASWAVHVSAEIGRARDDNNVALVVPGASEGHDPSDWFEPPPIGDFVSVSFAPPGGASAPLTVDARAPTGEGAHWPLRVQSNLRGQVALTFDELEAVPAEFVVWLVDEAGGAVRDLRQDPRYTVAVQSGAPVPLRLVIGTEAYAQATSGFDGTTPSEYGLSPSFPNPFSTVATIPYALPSAEHVVVEVFDVVGRRVAVLVDERVEAGYHRVVWDGRAAGGQAALASGVYVVRFRAGSFTATQRATLVR